MWVAVLGSATSTIVVGGEQTVVHVGGNRAGQVSMTIQSKSSRGIAE
ncbi:hypothetical protein [Prescottella agglutinans]|uniref:Uncharacterized protein n=1 Tax=Prescottella agglutinans TaxID=1644129 RepID=A0ABT6ML06_9NOCA|nr:hypothetical protein [Prescottella agglutinans]MDH6284549.1 hypothetical protein [Prescottella agglutinans]